MIKKQALILGLFLYSSYNVVCATPLDFLFKPEHQDKWKFGCALLVRFKAVDILMGSIEKHLHLCLQKKIKRSPNKYSIEQYLKFVERINRTVIKIRKTLNLLSSVFLLKVCSDLDRASTFTQNVSFNAKMFSWIDMLINWLLAYDGLDLFLAVRNNGSSIASILGKSPQLSTGPATKSDVCEMVTPSQVKLSLDQLILSQTVKDSILNETVRPFFDASNPNSSLVEGCGALFYGPPGTGKTTLAKALAKELGIKAIVSSGPAMQGLYIGEGINRIKELFDFAKNNAPCIVVIDEVDSISKKRGSTGHNSHSFDLTTNELLAQMDMCSLLPVEKRVFVIGTTNFTEGHDPALTRPGRMSAMIKLGNPCKSNRDKLVDFYWKEYAKEKVLGSELQDVISEITDGESPATIGALIKCLVRRVNQGQNVTVSSIIDAALSTAAGKVDQDVKKEYSPQCKRIVAMHEAGHAIAGFLFLKNAVSKFKYVSIEPRTGGSGGLTYFTHPSLDLPFKEDLEGLVAMSFGGGLGEELSQGTATHSTGVSSDYSSIYRTLGQMCDLGMLPDATASSAKGVKSQAIDKKFFEIRNKVRDKFSNSTIKAAVKALADALVQKDVLDCSQVISIPEVWRILA